MPLGVGFGLPCGLLCIECVIVVCGFVLCVCLLCMVVVGFALALHIIRLHVCILPVSHPTMASGGGDDHDFVFVFSIVEVCVVFVVCWACVALCLHVVSVLVFGL